MKKFLLALPFFLSLECQASQRLTPDQVQEMMRQSATVQENPVSSYIPQQIDVSRFLRAESKCYMVISRCVLQPLNVVAPLVATGLMAASSAIQDTRPDTSKILGWTACALSAVEFATSVLLAKVNDKLHGIDEYIEKQKIKECATQLAAEIMAESKHSSNAHTPAASSSENQSED